MSSPRLDIRWCAQALGIWCLAAVVSLWVAATTAIGPTVLVLSPTHGVHLGDLLAVLTCAAWAWDAAATRRVRR